MALEEGELIELFRQQHPDAFRKLYEQYAARMMAVCLRYMGDADDAGDVLQEGFIKVLKNIGSFRSEGSLEGWIRRIMVNTALLALRKNKLRYAESTNDHFELSSDFEEAIDRISMKELLRMIASLPTGYRTVFNLFVMEGYTHKQIAEELQINESTSRSQLTKARNLLQDMITRQRQDASRTLPLV